MPSRRGPAAALLAGFGRGVLTTAELRAGGFSSDMAEREVHAGRWQRPARGTYVPHAAPLSDAERIAVAMAYAGSNVIITGAVVLRELKMRWVPDTPDIHVLVPPDIERPSSGCVRITRTSCFDELETWSAAGAQFANPDRAVIDAARGTRWLRDVRGIVLAAIADGWASPTQLRTILDAGQRNGSGLTRRAITDGERGCASPPEAELVDEMIGRRLPFYVNPALWLDGVLLGEPDLWLVGLGIGGEVESKERHGSEPDLENTYDRHERITTPGIELVHLSVGRIRRDVREAASHLVSRALARQAIPAHRREPAGLRVVPRGPLLT